MKITSKTSFLISLLLFTVFIINAQSFQRSAVVISAGTGLGIYNTSYKFDVTGADSLKSGRAASFIFPLAVEVGLANRLGVEAQFAYSKFLKNDTAKEIANGVDLILKGHFHFIKRKKLNMFLSVNTGYAHFKYDSNDIKEGKINANGLNLGFGLGSRFYLSKRFGFYVNLDFPTNNYKGTATDNLSNNYDFKLKISGTIIGAGIQIKI